MGANVFGYTLQVRMENAFRIRQIIGHLNFSHECSAHVKIQ